MGGRGRQCFKSLQLRLYSQVTSHKLEEDSSLTSDPGFICHFSTSLERFHSQTPLAAVSAHQYQTSLEDRIGGRRGMSLKSLQQRFCSQVTSYKLDEDSSLTSDFGCISHFSTILERLHSQVPPAAVFRATSIRPRLRTTMEDAGDSTQARVGRGSYLYMSHL